MKPRKPFLLGGIVLWVAIVTMLVLPHTTYAAATLSNVTWCHAWDAEPTNDISGGDAVQITATLNNQDSLPQAYRVGVRLAQVSGGTRYDHTFGGPTHIFGNSTGTIIPTAGTLTDLNRLNASGQNIDVRESYGEVQNSYIIPAGGSGTITAYLTIAKEHGGKTFAIELYVYDFDSNTLQTSYVGQTIAFNGSNAGCLAGTGSDNLGTGTLITTPTNTQCPNSSCGKHAEVWINTDKPVYSDADTIVIEYAVMAGGAVPLYAEYFVNGATFQVYDVTANALATTISVGATCPTTPTATNGSVATFTCRAQTSYASKITPASSGYTYNWNYPTALAAQTNVLTLDPAQNPWLIEGHQYEIRMMDRSGTGSHYSPVPNLDRFTYLGSLSVTLNYFTATCRPNDIFVEWETASETNILGFNLYRSTSPDELGAQLNSEIIPSQAPGGGGAYYSFTDDTLPGNGTYYYHLEHVETNGNSQVHAPTSAVYPCVPTAVTLSTLTVEPLVTPMTMLFTAGLLLMGGWIIRRSVIS